MNILLVDDSIADASLTKLALLDTLPDSHITVATDGAQALQYLSETENAPFVIYPDLVICDLNMPRMDGFSLIEQIKAHPEFQSLPIMILTTSSSTRDIERANQLGVLTYFTKPWNWDDYKILASAITKAWTQWRSTPHVTGQESSDTAPCGSPNV